MIKLEDDEILRVIKMAIAVAFPVHGLVVRILTKNGGYGGRRPYKTAGKRVNSGATRESGNLSGHARMAAIASVVAGWWSRT